MRVASERYRKENRTRASCKQNKRFQSIQSAAHLFQIVSLNDGAVAEEQNLQQPRFCGAIMQ